MLTYATAQSVANGEFNGGAAPIKVLLVSDWAENLARVKSCLRLSHHKIVYAQTAEELNLACHDLYDFVVIDVGPEHIAYALRELRANTQLQNIPILVRAERFAPAFEATSVFAKSRALPELDSERLAKEFAMTSIFTKYRAMPGLDTELARLVSSRTKDKERLHGLNALPDETAT